MKSRRVRVASSSRQNASTLGVWRRSRPKISSRSPHSPKSGSCAYRFAASRGNRVVTIRLRAAAQQLEARLVANLHAAARQQRHASAQVGQLRAFAEVEGRALRTELIVEVMNQRILLLADVTVLQFCACEVCARCGVRPVRTSLGRSNRRLGRKHVRAYGTRGLRRSVWIPVAARATWSRSTRAAFARAP